MIEISTSGNSILFTFEDSQHYLYGNGVIETPKNSLILVTDSSEMATFKKIDGDIFLSALYSELGITKSELISYYEANMVGSTGGGGGGGVTSGEVQTMIDESISGKAESSAVTEVEEVTARALNDLDSRKSDTSAVTVAISEAVSGKCDTSALTEVEEVTARSLNDLNSRKADSSAVTEAISAATSGLQETLSAGTGIDISGNVISATGGGATYSAGTGIDITDNVISVTGSSSGGITSGKCQEMIDESISGKIDTSAVTTSVTSASTDSEIPTAKAVYDAIPTGGTGGDMTEKSYIGTFTTNGGKYYDYGDIIYLTANNTGNTTGYCQMANNCTWSSTNYNFDFTAHTVTASNSNNDNYISVVWDNAMGMFKITALTSGCSLFNSGGDNVKWAKVMFTVPSGTTEEYIETGLQDVTTIASMIDGKSIDNMYYTLNYKLINTYVGLKDGLTYNPQIGLGDGLCNINNKLTAVVKSETFGEWGNVTIPANSYNAQFTETSAVTFTLTNALQEGCSIYLTDAYGNSYVIYDSNGAVNNDWDVTVDGNTVTATKRSGYNNAIGISYGCAYLENVISNLQMYKTSYTIDEYAAKIESESLGGLKLQKVTQNEYDALVSGGTVDNNTLYVIV